MNELYLFVSTFILVFALGLQSLNVNGGYYVRAFLTSFVIGGPFGIVCSIFAHQWINKKLVRR